MSRIGLVLEGGGMRGLYTAGVLDTMMDRGFRPDVICATSAGVTFGVNLPSGQKGRVTNVRTGQAEYMLIDDCDEKMDIIRASASLPFVSRKVNIGGTPYLDGGIVDNIPLDKCISLGCESIIVVLTHSLDFVRKGSAGVAARLLYPRDTKLAEAPRCITELSKLSFGMYLMHLFFLSNIAPLFIAGNQASPLLPVYLSIPCIAVLAFICCAVTSKMISLIPGSRWVIG